MARRAFSVSSWWPETWINSAGLMASLRLGLMSRVRTLALSVPDLSMGQAYAKL